MPHPDPIAAQLAGGPSVFSLLSTVRSRRVGVGYRVDSGRTEQHPVTGRAMAQADGPQHWVSERPPTPLSDDEQALLAWATLGPNGVVAWEASVSGSFSQLVSTRGRTAPEPNNTMATDLLVVDDDGVHLYRPTSPWPSAGQQVEPELVREYWRAGRTRLLDGRPDLDFAVRDPAYPNVPLMGTHQYNINRPGSSWLLPITDAGRLLSGLLDLFTGKHVYVVDEFHGGRPAGLEPFARAGMLEKPVPISAHEQGVLRTSTYPAGCMVQNTRLAAEAMGLGAWCLSGYDQDVVLGAHPHITAGLGFTVAPENPRAPLPIGRRHTHGIPGVKTSTCVPSPDHPDARSLVDRWYADRYGPGAWGDADDSSLLGPDSPWPDDRARALAAHPETRLPEWAWDAAHAYIDYCVQTFGQYPVTFDPMLAGFGTVVHHVDTDYYDELLRPGYITRAVRTHDAVWHRA